MESGVSRVADTTIYVAHLFAASVWIGGLVPLGYLLYSALRKRNALWLAAAQSALPRYSQAGIAAVALLLASGIFISWSLVGGIAALFRTAYGQLLVLKISLFLLMVGLAVFNRFILMPKVVVTKSNTSSRDQCVSKLLRNVAVEQVLAILVLAVVSVLGTVAPAAEENAMTADISVVGTSAGDTSDWRSKEQDLGNHKPSSFAGSMLPEVTS